MNSNHSRTATILHMSDFHFRSGPQSVEQMLVLQSLLTAIEQIVRDKSWQPELVLCTGDIAYSGVKPDYELAEDWFSRLLGTLALKKDRLYVVPGNHDIDMSKLEEAHRPLLRKLGYQGLDALDNTLIRSRYQELMDLSNRIFKDQEVVEGLLTKFHSYRQFSQEYLGRPYNDDLPLFSDVIRTASGITFGLLGLNSSLLFANRGKANEYGHQLLSVLSLFRGIEILRSKGNRDITVVMYHHPLNWLCEGQRTTVRDTLGERADLVLEGHEDDPEQQYYYMGTGLKRALVLKEGPAYDGVQYPNRVEFIRCEITDTKKAFEVYSLTYDGPSTRWVLDASTFARQGRNDNHGYFIISEDTTSTKPPIHITHWDEFFSACHKFEKGRQYVLITGEMPSGSTDKSALARVDWNLVFDFDPETDKTGLYHEVANTLGSDRMLHLLTLDERVPIVPERSTYWIASRGRSGRPTTLVPDDLRSWNRRYSQGLRDVIHAFGLAAGEQPVTVVVLWNKIDYVRAICEVIDQVFGDSADFVFATSYMSQVSPVATIYKAPIVPIVLGDVLNGLQAWMQPRKTEAETAQLPNIEGPPVPVSHEDLLWLSEDLEIVHLGVGAKPAPSSNPGRDFLRGSSISWFELAIHSDVDREKTVNLQAQVERDLESRSTTRINLYHWPGSGGTTVARRVAWNLHTRYPTVQLCHATVDGTESRLRRLYELTKLPVLVLAEGSNIPETMTESLFSAVRATPFPVVFLNVSRRFQHPARESERTVYLDSTLSNDETKWFIEAYGREVPLKRRSLEAAAQGTSHERCPFFLGLVAFGKDFVALEKYVADRLKGATREQRDVIVFLSFAYHYGQVTLPSQLFHKTIQIPQNATVKLDQALTEPLLDLLIRESETTWRPVHDLVAQEVLEQVLAGSASDRRVWVQNLSSWARDFATLCSNPGKTPSEELGRIMREIFLLRGQSELLGTEGLLRSRYSRLIDEVPSVEGKLGVLQHLTELFPEEPHFWGHLARFYMQEFRDVDRALKAINSALALTDKDDVLYHIKGMILGRQALDQMDSCRRIGRCTSDELEIIGVLIQQAGEQFGKARLYAPPENEYGYVSHIQLLISAVDFGFLISGHQNRTEFLASAQAAWCLPLLDAAEGLLEDLTQAQQGERTSRRASGCRASLRLQYGDFAGMLSTWNGLLGRKDVYQPMVRREIVRTFLTRENRAWDKLGQPEVNRILDLMEQNVSEEPSDDRNIRHWFEAVRWSGRYGIERTIERLSYWRLNSPTIEPSFYLYIVHALKALDGSIVSRKFAEDFVRESSEKARQQRIRNRTFSIEWLGKGQELRRLINYKYLGNLDEEFRSGARLARVDGAISRVASPAAGEIELACGLKAFFVPSRKFFAGRDENKPVTFCLSFSYDGLRAWDVRQS